MIRFATALLLVCLAAAQQPDTVLQKAIAAHQRGDLDAAVAGYREFLRTNPHDVNVLSNLGAALSKQGKYGEAVATYKEGLKQGGTNPPLLLNLALAYYKMGELRNAVPELEKFHKLMPGSEQGTMLLADCYLQMSENDKVIGLLTPLNDRDPENLAVAYMLGTALLRDRQDYKGQKVLDPIFRRGESAESHMLLGTAKMNAADFTGAVDEFSKAVKLNPDLPSLQEYYGQALTETGDNLEAAKAFREELKHNPYNFNANLNLAVILKQSQEYDEALKLLTEALRARPGDLRVRYQQAAIYVAQGRFEDGRKELESILKEAPQFLEAHVTLASVYYRLKRREEGDRERAIVQKLKQEQQSQDAKGEAGK
jgi:tetratricopeptide (TPR) repeat protein